MDRDRFSTIAHRTHRFLSPISPAHADELVDALAMPRGGLAVDVGCGKGAFLLCLMERSGCRGIGLETNHSFLDDARAAHATRLPDATVEWREGDARAFAPAPASIDAALCLGATHALGGYANALRTLKGWIRPGGRLLVGEGYWRHEPDPDYLTHLGGSRDEFTGHAANLARGVAEGLIAIAAEESSLEEWDDYEGRYADSIEAFVAEHPRDRDADEMLRRIRSWRDAYLRWGRDTLGFGAYVFEVR